MLVVVDFFQTAAERSDLRCEEHQICLMFNIISGVLCHIGKIRRFLFPLIILGGLIRKEREETMLQCFVSNPEGGSNSIPPC